jgi:hypothetical protein
MHLLVGTLGCCQSHAEFDVCLDFPCKRNGRCACVQSRRSDEIRSCRFAPAMDGMNGEPSW